jgi:hypothetical protein
VNHHGAVDNAEFLQHGGRGNIAIMTIQEMVKRQNDDTAAALERHIDSGHFGSVGLVLLPDLFVVGNAESHLTEDGGNRITFVDRRTGSLRGEIELALGNPGFACPDFPFRLSLLTGLRLRSRCFPRILRGDAFPTRTASRLGVAVTASAIYSLQTVAPTTFQ